MKDIGAKINWKILLVFLVLIFILILAVTLLFGKSNIVPESSPKPTAATEQSISKSGWKTYKQFEYSISYPSSLKLIPEETEKGIRMLGLRKSDDPSFAINIDILPTLLVLDKIYDLLEKDGYKMSSAVVADIPARTYTGSIKISNQQVRQIVTIFTYKEKIYEIRLDYVSLEPNKLYVDLYYEILTTFKFTD